MQKFHKMLIGFKSDIVVYIWIALIILAVTKSLIKKLKQ